MHFPRIRIKENIDIIPELPRQSQELQAFPEMASYFRKYLIPAIACDIYKAKQSRVLVDSDNRNIHQLLHRLALKQTITN